jgi:hypothetical protein
MSLSNECHVAIIGAGPYGLATAAHLRAANVETRVFGEPMEFWRQNMPQGMRLRSPWVATHIPDPQGRFSLDAFFAGRAQPDLLPLADFVDYGLWFQHNAVPDVDRRRVLRVEPTARGFRLYLDDRSLIEARRVIVAAGLREHAFRPAVFAGLPRALVSHSSDPITLADFRGRRVAVIGTGQSACESAALLNGVGAEVDLIGREPIRWTGDPHKGSALRRALRPFLGGLLATKSAVGPFPYNWLNEAPGLTYWLPDRVRAITNATSLVATASTWLRPGLNGVRVSVQPVMAAERQGDRVALQFADGIDVFDHVLLATGYAIDVARIHFLPAPLAAAIACRDGSPVLSRALESSVGGLHFTGAAAVSSFGPLLRFIAGARFAAERIARNVASARGREWTMHSHSLGSRSRRVPIQS